MSNLKFIALLILLMSVCYSVGYFMGEHNTNTKWHIEQSKKWRPLVG